MSKPCPQATLLTCREFDAYTRRWGADRCGASSAAPYLAEACFRLLTDAFTPLARVEPPDDDGQAQLAMKGGGLPRPRAPTCSSTPGDVYLPLLRRTGRGGELAEGGVTVMPWTLLIADEPDDTGWTASVETASGVRPLNGRRRGPSSNSRSPSSDPASPSACASSPAAIASRASPATKCSASRRKAPPELLGVTDRDGMIDVPAGRQARHDAAPPQRWPGARQTARRRRARPSDRRPDRRRRVRLAAQGEVQAVREELIDVVARRAILIARVQALLKEGKVDDARELMDELNDLPTASVFASRIDAVMQRLPKSDDPRVRQTIEGLFTATRELLAQIPRRRAPITDLQSASQLGTARLDRERGLRPPRTNPQTQHHRQRRHHGADTVAAE